MTDLDGERRRVLHDHHQAMRRTTAQNRALIEVVNNGINDTWELNDLPPEGGVVHLKNMRTGREWTIELDGTLVTKEND